jgi:hypothetical protein
MEIQILVVGQSRINRAFSGLPLLIDNCRKNLELVLGIYLTHDGCLYLAWMDRQSRECAECGEPGHLLMHMLWSTVSGCFVVTFLQALIFVELPILGSIHSSVSKVNYRLLALLPCSMPRSASKDSSLIFMAPHMYFSPLRISLCGRKYRLGGCIQWSVDE